MDATHRSNARAIMVGAIEDAVQCAPAGTELRMSPLIACCLEFRIAHALAHITANVEGAAEITPGGPFGLH